MLDAADRHASLGLHCQRAGRSDQAEALFRLGLVHRPADAGLLLLLGQAAGSRQAWGRALDGLRRARRLDPLDANTLSALGAALAGCGRGVEAIAAHRHAAALRPDDADILYALANTRHGLALGDDDRLAEAEGGYRAAARLRPDLLKAHLNLGNLLVARARLEEACAAFRQAIRLAPDQARAHWNLSLALLLRGRLDEGWEEYEWRWRETTFPSPARGFSQPLWEGEALDGRTILLHAEQGLGDAIHFVRYAPLVAARGGRVVLEVQKPLARLMSGLPGVAEVVALGDPPPPFDRHCPLLSLPRAFATTLASIPASVPYLWAEPALTARWGRRLAAGCGEGARVGLVWAGNPRFDDDRARSPGLAALRPLLEVSGVAFVALQKGEGRRDLEAGGERLAPSFLDLGPEIEDFADTAAIMMNLDLVISSCTAPPLLAGALGRPCWLALKRVPDWRWLMEGEDSPWYPSLRLFRQTRAGDWDGVFARMAGELARWRDAGRRASDPVNNDR